MKVKEFFKFKHDSFSLKEGYYLNIGGQTGESLSMANTVEIKRDGTVIYTGKPDGIMRYKEDLESFTITEDKKEFIIRFSMNSGYVPVVGDEIITV